MPEQGTQTYTARWIFPVAGPPLPRGTITVLGDKIVAVEPHGRRRADVDFGDAAILPGFVNAHTHLDLTGLRGQCPPSPNFTDWLRGVIAFRRVRSPAQVRSDIAAGAAECVRIGTTLIGNISSGIEASRACWDLLPQANCRAVVFHELLGLSEDRAALSWQTFQEWLGGTSDKNDAIRPGVSPHAPYSVRRSLYEEVAKLTLPIATHLAETREELELLRSHTGPFVDFLKELNVWDPSGLIADPQDFVALMPRAVFVHANYLDPATGFSKDQSVVVCPRTHVAFGHPAHPFPHWLTRGVRVALGTDSLASNPDLDILAEARFLRQRYPEVEPAMLLRMLTLSGAEALGHGDVTGSLQPGKSADLVLLPLPGDKETDPHDGVLQSTADVQGVMLRGAWVYPP